MNNKLKSVAIDLSTEFPTCFRNFLQCLLNVIRSCCLLSNLSKSSVFQMSGTRVGYVEAAGEVAAEALTTHVGVLDAFVLIQSSSCCSRIRAVVTIAWEVTTTVLGVLCPLVPVKVSVSSRYVGAADNVA